MMQLNAMLPIVVGLGVYAYVIYVNFVLITWLNNLDRYSETAARYAVVVGIDGDGASPPAESVDIVAVVRNVLLMGLFALQHSMMARQTTKKLVTKALPFYLERTFYVLCAASVLHIIMTFWAPLPRVLYEIPSPWWYIVWTLSALGLAVNVSSTWMIDHFDLLGLRQVFMGKKYSQPRFMVRYLYKYVRNPIYLGFLTHIFIAPTMTLGRLVFGLCSLSYILFGIQLEEKDLAHAVGKKYKTYKKAVPMLIPSTKPYAVAQSG